MKNLTIIFLALTLVLVGAMFANNTLAKDEPSKKISGNICTKEYAPVCGIDGITYGNACMAQTTEIAYIGECNSNITAGGTFPAGEVTGNLSNEELAKS